MSSEEKPKTEKPKTNRKSEKKKTYETLTNEQLITRLQLASNSSPVVLSAQMAEGGAWFRFPLRGVRITVEDEGKPDFVELIVDGKARVEK